MYIPSAKGCRLWRKPIKVLRCANRSQYQDPMPAYAKLCYVLILIHVLITNRVKKEDIKINATEDSVEVKSTDVKRKYHKNIELPKNIDIESVKSQFNNGVLEITFNKKKENKPKGKEIRID